MSNSAFDAPDTATLAGSIQQCIANGKNLLEDARLLFGFDRFSTAFAFSVLAQEESSKAFILQLVNDQALSWTPAIRRAMAKHNCKHLLSIVLHWLPQFDFDNLRDQNAIRDQRHRATMAWYQRQFERAANGLPMDSPDDPKPAEPAIAFPGDVAAALNIFRFEEIEVLEGRDRWADIEWSNGHARRIADGALDRRKQSALYVGITRSGDVGSHPGLITKDEATAAISSAERLSDQPIMFSDEYAALKDAVRQVFGVPPEHESAS